MRKVLALILLLAGSSLPSFSADSLIAKRINPLIKKHPGKSAAYVLEKGEQALLARAWLGDHAQKSIDVQYFIWSSDNIGILATEALVRAADRGAQVRVLVDDFLIEAKPEELLAVASHPKIDIRIYNARSTVGVTKTRKHVNTALNFRKQNQRMHDKTFTVDGMVSIIGGRNMADEYFDYNSTYTFRDRDALVMGPVVKDVTSSFELFWNNPLSQPVEELLAVTKARLTDLEIQTRIQRLHAYAKDPANFEPEVHDALRNLPKKFTAMINDLVWDDIRFVHDIPGKNNGGFYGGGDATKEIKEALLGAKSEIVIQSPYLVMPRGGWELFRRLIKQGVRVTIVTNSLAATDNLYAFSGYRKRRGKLLKEGFKLFEYRPDPAVRKVLIERYPKMALSPPVFAIHAKTMIIDGKTAFIGTFNFDPRSANLNTEVGVLIRNKKLASGVRETILNDTKPENSWNPATEDSDSYAPLKKRIRLWLYERLPVDPIL